MSLPLIGLCLTVLCVNQFLTMNSNCKGSRELSVWNNPRIDVPKERAVMSVIYFVNLELCIARSIIFAPIFVHMCFTTNVYGA